MNFPAIKFYNFDHQNPESGSALTPMRIHSTVYFHTEKLNNGQ